MRTVVVLSLCAFVIGCTSVDEATKKQGPAARARLAKTIPIAADLAQRPPVTRDEVAPLGTAVMLDASGGARANATIVYLEDLAAPGELGIVYARLPGSRHLAECAAFLEHKTNPWDPRDPTHWTQALGGWSVESRLEHCGRLDTVFAVRTMELARPSTVRIEAGAVDGGAPRSGALPSEVNEATCATAGVRCAFDGGHIKAEVHVYTLEPFAHRGAFVVEAESTDKIRVSSTPSEQTLEDDLAAALRKAFVDRLAKNIAGAESKGFQ